MLNRAQPSIQLCFCFLCNSINLHLNVRQQRTKWQKDVYKLRHEFVFSCQATLDYEDYSSQGVLTKQVFLYMKKVHITHLKYVQSPNNHINYFLFNIRSQSCLLVQSNLHLNKICPFFSMHKWSIKLAFCGMATNMIKYFREMNHEFNIILIGQDI